MSIENYLDSKKFAWSPSTLRSERYRLQGIIAHLDGNPETLWQALQSHKPYTRVTTWTRVVEYWDFLIDEGKQDGKNAYRQWRKTNARLFKNTYVRQKPEITYEEARSRIQTITDGAIRDKALQLLTGGLRFTESDSIEDGQVIGKGGKSRRVYVLPSPTSVAYHRVYAALAAIGIKPHDLRKLFLSRLVDSGANEFELCEIAGWSNLNTASSYIKNDAKKLELLVKKARSL